MKTQERIYIAIAVITALGFRVWVRHLARDANGSAPTANLTGNQIPVDLTIKVPAPPSEKEYESIKRGMTFPDVSRILRIKRLSGPVDMLFQHEYVLVKFEEEDGSRTEIEFRDGKEFRKSRLDASDARAADSRRD